MSVATLLGAGASGFGMVVAASPLLQIKRAVDLRRSDDVSLPFLFIITFSTYLWAAYGLATADWFIFTPNALAAITSSANVAVVRHFRTPTLSARARSARPPGAPPS